MMLSEGPLEVDASCLTPRRRGTNGVAAVVWFTGLSGSGKTTLCCAVAECLRRRGWAVEVLDGDAMRRTLCADLGYSREDREQSLGRIGSLAAGLAAQGAVVLVAAIAPYRAMRRELRNRLENFVEVYVNAPLATCIERDPKGLYRRALAGEIDSFTGISDVYEAPLAAEIECNTDRETVEESVGKLMEWLVMRLVGERGLRPGGPG